MKYDIHSELKKFAHISMPVSTFSIKAANALMPYIQKESSPYEEYLDTEEIDFHKFKALLIQPKGYEGETCFVYYHGGGFVMKAARYHKNLVREYAYRANIAVLFVDYRLAAEAQFPVPLADCLKAYYWSINHYKHVFVGGDSAGGNLAIGVCLKGREIDYRMPEKMMLIYPVTDSRMETESMKIYTDTPLWNAENNKRMWELYTKKEDRHHTCASVMEAEHFRQFPATYIETAQYDCLHDEGVAFAQRLRKDGISVKLIETKRTIHGFDIAEKAPFVRMCVDQRINFLMTDHKVIL